jgi:hypothetical protein
MAHVQITLLEGRTVEQKRRAVKRITEVLSEESWVFSFLSDLASIAKHRSWARR